MLLFLDLETTGFDNKKDTILEIAAARWDGERIIDKYETIIKIDENVKISNFVQNLTGITPEMCQKEGIPLSQARIELNEFLQDDDIITGHNISFDTGFLKENTFDITQREIDTFILSLLVMGRTEESHSLEVLSEKYGLIHENAHRAMSDVEANIAFYEVMEIFWIHNYSQYFHDFVMQKIDIIQFPETYFFTNSQKKKEILEKTEIPQPTFPPFKQEWNEKTEIFEKVISELDSEKKCIFWETPLADRYLNLFCEYAEQKKKQLVFLYPDDKRIKYQEFFDSLLQYRDQNNKSSDNICFLNDNSQKFDEKKWGEFIIKKEKTREETLVYCKTIRAKELHQEYALKFMREEGVVARNLYQNEIQKTLPEEFSILFLPFSHSEIIPENIQRIILDGDRIEDLITQNYTTKIFTNRWREDEILNGTNREMNEKSKQWDILLANIAKVFRKSKGENEYTLPIPYSQAKNINGFPELWVHGKNIMDTMPENIQNNWKIFFSPEMDNNLFFQIELFPDNQLAFSAMPIDISEYSQKILTQNTLIMGSSFPRYNDKILFSFPLPRNFSDIYHEREVLSNFAVPNVQRTITAKESIPFAVEYMKSGENILFSVNSKRICEEVLEAIRENAKESGYIVLAQGSGSVGKMRVKLMTNKPKIFIATPRYLDIVRPEDFGFSIVMIMKAMFDPPKNPFLSERRKLYKNDFEEFSIPRAVYRFEKELRRCDNIEKVFLGDGRVGDKRSWARIFWRGEEQKLF